MLVLGAAVALLLNGCRPEGEEKITDQTSKLVVRGSEMAVSSPENPEEVEPVIFTGDDILWFNTTTGEIRFRDNMWSREHILGWQSVKFYIDEVHLFSSKIFVSDLSSAIYNSLVFYYSTQENKFYLADGYPLEVSVLSHPQAVQEERDRNRKEIADEWDRFIAEMEKENKLRTDEKETPNIVPPSQGEEIPDTAILKVAKPQK